MSLRNKGYVLDLGFVTAWILLGTLVLSTNIWFLCIPLYGIAAYHIFYRHYARMSRGIKLEAKAEMDIREGDESA